MGIEGVGAGAGVHMLDKGVRVHIDGIGERLG
jgi:hypothetical protein